MLVYLLCPSLVQLLLWLHSTKFKTPLHLGVVGTDLQPVAAKRCNTSDVDDKHFPSGLWDVFQVDHCPKYRTWSKLGFGSPMTKLEIWHMMKNVGSKNDFWFHRLSYADTTCIALLQDTYHFTVLLLLIWLLALELALNIGKNSRVYQHFPSCSPSKSLFGWC